MDESNGRNAVLDNARRLLSDARLLYVHGRFPTASSVAILSIEEFGKAVGGMSSGHLDKQTAAASFGFVKHLISFLEAHGLEFKWQEAVTEDQRIAMEDPNF
jgi:AbiV family abortive infection protein